MPSFTQRHWESNVCTFRLASSHNWSIVFLTSGMGKEQHIQSFMLSVLLKIGIFNAIQSIRHCISYCHCQCRFPNLLHSNYPSRFSVKPRSVNIVLKISIFVIRVLCTEGAAGSIINRRWDADFVSSNKQHKQELQFCYHSITHWLYSFLTFDFFSKWQRRIVNCLL